MKNRILLSLAAVCAAAGLAFLLSGCMAGNMFAALCVNPNLAEREFNWGGRHPVQAVLCAWDLGDAVYDGRAVRHYRVDGMLRSGRSVDLYLDSMADSNGHRSGVLIERHEIPAMERGVPCCFFMNAQSGDFPLRMPLDKLDPGLTGTDAMSRNLYGGYITDAGYFYVSAAKGTAQWYCRVALDWSRRIPWMVPIRPLYGLPAAVCMLPADVLFCVESLFEIPLHGVWANCYSWGRLGRKIGEIGTNDVPGTPDPNAVYLYAPYENPDQPRTWLSPR